jgi:hypothetical protein
MGRDQDDTLEGWNRGLIYFRACVERSIGPHFKCRNTLIVSFPSQTPPPPIDLRQRKGRLWKSLIEFIHSYNSYNWLDVVHKHSSRRLSVPSPVAASTHEEPGAWIDHLDR